MTVLLAVLDGLALLFWLMTLLDTIRRNRRQEWVLKVATPLPDPGNLPRISLLIPARNEERNLEACLTAVRLLDWPDLEIIMVDDHSTDATGRIASVAAALDPRIRVLPSAERPQGWMGKSWALQQAQGQATGAWLLFLDADVVVHPQALRQAYRYAKAQGASMLSGYGSLVLETFWERVIMPVIGGMIVGANPLEEVNDPAHPRVICNGQFILVERRAYVALGGHESVKGEIIDDVAMAREAKAKKVPYRMVFCRELFRTRMYVGFGEIWRGWTKNIFAGMGYRPAAALAAVLFVLVTAVLPPVTAGVGPGWVRFLGLGATALMFGYRIYAARVFDQDWRFFWSHPLGAFVVCGIFLDSALKGMLGRTVGWKGREYRAGGPAVD